MSKKLWACWQCGKPSPGKKLACRRCRKKRPAAVKSTIAFVGKAAGMPPKPLRVKKPPRPRCPNPQCGVKGSRKRNCCERCGTAFSPVTAVKAAAAGRRLGRAPGRAEQIEALASLQHDPDRRERLRADAAHARDDAGAATAHAARLLVKASGGRSLREAWVWQQDSRAQTILLDALYGTGR